MPRPIHFEIQADDVERAMRETPALVDAASAALSA
jgi:hypothetical protein